MLTAKYGLSVWSLTDLYSGQDGPDLEGIFKNLEEQVVIF
jgi:hypothetical protein